MDDLSGRSLIVISLLIIIILIFVVHDRVNIIYLELLRWYVLEQIVDVLVDSRFSYVNLNFKLMILYWEFLLRSFEFRRASFCALFR